MAKTHVILNRDIPAAAAKTPLASEKFFEMAYKAEGFKLQTWNAASTPPSLR